MFHFLPDLFSTIVNSATVDECLFAAGRGIKKKEVSYPFADVVTSEILVGFASGTEDFYEVLAVAMSGTKELAIRFADEAESLISRNLDIWGFQFSQRRIPG